MTRCLYSMSTSKSKIPLCIFWMSFCYNIGVIIIINDNKIVIDKNITRLTPQVVLIQALKFTPLSLRNSTDPVKNMFCKEGNSLFTSNNLNKTGSMEKIPGNVILYGGFNGGGVASMNIKTAIPHSGGGGGAKGGNSALNSLNLRSSY